MKAEWTATLFEECIVRVIYSQKIQRQYFLKAGPYPIISQEADLINGYWDKEADLFRVETPIIVFGDHTKVLKYIDFDFVLGADGVKILRPREFLIPKFLFYQLHTAQLDSLGYARHYKLLKKLKIAYPTLAEQQRIVAILDKALEIIAIARANAEKNILNSRALFESQLHAVFNKRGDNWTEKPLSEMAIFKKGINFTKSSEGKSIKILGVKDFKNNYWAPLDDLELVTPSGTIPDSDTLQEGDVVFVRSNGSPELIGRCLLIGRLSERTTHSGFTIKARLRTREVSPKYLCHFLKSNVARKEMINGGNGANIKNLNQGTLSRLIIPFPSVVDQIRIVNRIENLYHKTQRLESLYQCKLTALDELKKSLLQKIFSGKLSERTLDEAEN